MRTSTRRAVSVSAGTLVLCLSGAGAAMAATLPAPSLDGSSTVADCSVPPSPDQLPGCATDTVTGVVATVEKAAGLAPGSSDGSAKTSHKPASAPHVTHSQTSAHPAAPTTRSTAAQRPAPPSIALPATTGSVLAAGQSPAVASPTRAALQSAASPLAPLDKGAPANILRAVLVALAAASAGALAASHVGIARLGLGRVTGRR